MALSFKGGYRFPYTVARELPITDIGYPSQLIMRVPKGFVPAVSNETILSHDTVIATHDDGSVLLAGTGGRVLSVTNDVVVILPDASEEFVKTPLCETLTDIPAQEIIQHIRRAGLMAEQGYPLWRMLFPLVGKGEMLILNAAESEPGVSCVHAMLRAYPEKILGGLKILMRALALPKASVVMTETMHYEAEVLRRHLKKKNMLDFLAVAEQYPIENPAVLFAALTGSRNAPSKRDIAIVSVVDCIAVYDLFVDGIVSLRRVLTVDGKNYSVCLGTPVSDLEILCSVTTNEGAVAHLGGFVSARKAEGSASVWVDTKAIQYLSEYYPCKTDCIQCGKCTLCPVGLLPMRLMQSIAGGKENRLKHSGIEACIDCGICTAVCSVKLDPRAAIYAYLNKVSVSANDLAQTAVSTEIENVPCTEHDIEYEEIGTIDAEEGSHEKTK